MRLAEWTDRIRHSLWFVPTLCTLAAAALALLLIWVSEETDLDVTGLPLIFSAGVDGARAMLQAIAGSIITVAGVIFSITIVALQLTSTQFSPRVLRNFLRDRSNQIVLGVFVGTFIYTLLVLRSIRSQDADASAFVPSIAITGALVLTLVAMGMLIYFIHHISVRIQVTSIVASVAEDTLETIGRMSRRWQPAEDRPWQPAASDGARAVPPSGAVPAEAVPPSELLLPARESGYLQFVDIGRLVEVAREAGGRLRLLVAPGAWVQAGVPCAAFVPATAKGRADPEHLADAMKDAFGIGHERSMSEDVAFGVQQLVDVAIKALSPSVNDPTTAMNCIDRLVQVLVAAGTDPDPPRVFADADRDPRLEIPFPGFDELVDLSFDQIRHYGGTAPAVVVHLARALSQLRALPPARRAALTRQARLLAEAAAHIELEAERRHALEAIGPLLD
ncbi:MAG TPA: DUF2254 domain-containing protein [Patescibacteria group bacterium]|nr:DUF2254 domain-containing protein [Patescibacteria group bacterium]